MADHVHIFSGLSRTTSLAELVKNLKTSSTMTIKAKGHSHFSWQSGYGAFSVRESVVEYIASQEIHHRKMSFQEKFRTILKKHGVLFDERYVWD
jgi:REP element-mobilizing transposase RayT